MILFKMFIFTVVGKFSYNETLILEGNFVNMISRDFGTYIFDRFDFPASGVVIIPAF